MGVIYAFQATNRNVVGEGGGLSQGVLTAYYWPLGNHIWLPAAWLCTIYSHPDLRLFIFSGMLEEVHLRVFWKVQFMGRSREIFRAPLFSHQNTAPLILWSMTCSKFDYSTFIGGLNFYLQYRADLEQWPFVVMILINTFRNHCLSKATASS